MPMNVIAPLRLAGTPVRLAATPRNRKDAIRLGMPHLSGCGISENWLLKELGHRHWMMLAGQAGMNGPDFRDDEGRQVYAAFCAVRLTDARLDLGVENGALASRSTMRRVSRTQVENRHELRIDGVAAGLVEMVSTFIRRTGRGNHSVARVALDDLVPVDPSPSDLASLAATLRARRRPHHFGIDLSAASTEIAVFEFDPCPELDFNGAGFLYFPSFLAFVDRAEWQLSRRRSALARRDAFYHGNVDPGVPIRVVLVAEEPVRSTRWWRLERTDERAILADVFTQRL